MKKILFILLTVLISLSFASCSNKQEESNEKVEEEGLIGMPNPMKECSSLDEINKIAGTHIVIPSSINASNLKYFTINNDLAEVRFTLDNLEWTIRGSKNVDMDISGIADENNVFESGQDGVVYLNDYYIDRIFVDDFQYTTVVKNQNNYDVETFSNHVFNIDKSLRAASDINGIAGMYQDSTSQRASLEILKFGDLYDLTVTWPSSASEVTYYYISGNYEKNKITYGGEQIVTYQYDENGEETPIDSTATNNLGYFEIKDGKLYWTGAAQDQCKTCVFEKIEY